MSFLYIGFLLILLLIFVPQLYLKITVSDLYNTCDIIDELGSLRYYCALSYINNNTHNKIDEIVYNLSIKNIILNNVLINKIKSKNYTSVFINISNIITKLKLNRSNDIIYFEKIIIIISIVIILLLTSILITIIILKNNFNKNLNIKDLKLKNYINSDNHMFHIVKNDYFIISSLLQNHSCENNIKEILKIIEIGMNNCSLRNIFYRIMSNSYIISCENINITQILFNNVIKFDTIINKQNIQNIVSDSNILKIILQNIYSNIIKHGNRPYICIIKNINNNIQITFKNSNKKINKKNKSFNSIGLNTIKLCCEYLDDIDCKLDRKLEFTEMSICIKQQIIENPITLSIKNDELVEKKNIVFLDDNSSIKNENDKLVEKKNIVFLDDNIIIRKIIRKQFAKYFSDYDTLIYGTEYDIINFQSIIKLKKPFLIILDNNLGGEYTGVELARKLVAKNIVKNNQIIILSGDNLITQKNENEFEFIDKATNIAFKIKKIKNVLNTI